MTAKKQQPAVVESAPSAELAADTWDVPEGCIVSEAKSYTLWVDGTRYEHVSEAPDGRWVYARS
jgi:hypothetical protein